MRPSFKVYCSTCIKSYGFEVIPYFSGLNSQIKVVLIWTKVDVLSINYAVKYVTMLFQCVAGLQRGQRKECLSNLF